MANALTIDSGPLQARIFQDTGQLALAGPDCAGTPHANVITFEPPVATIEGTDAHDRPRHLLDAAAGRPRARPGRSAGRTSRRGSRSRPTG